jgi:hypothetical protein
VEYSLTVNDTGYIQCTSPCSEIVVSFSEPSLFPPPTCEGATYVDALVCGIDYRIDYDQKKIYINFQVSNSTNTLEDQQPSESLVQKISLGLSQNLSSQNEITREYFCNTNNDCAKQFYLNSINYFVTEGISQLDLIRNKLHNDSLLIGEGSRRYCINSDNVGKKPAEKCKFGFCYAEIDEYELNEQKFTKKIQKCDSYDTPFLFSEIEHHTPKSPSREREFIKYRCNKHVCNRDDNIEKLKIFINEYTNGTSKIPNNKIISDKQGNLSIKQTISSYSLVLSLFLIQLFI